jgi:hypothetical protein
MHSPSILPCSRYLPTQETICDLEQPPRYVYNAWTTVCVLCVTLGGACRTITLELVLSREHIESSSSGYAGLGTDSQPARGQWTRRYLHRRTPHRHCYVCRSHAVPRRRPRLPQSRCSRPYLATGLEDCTPHHHTLFSFRRLSR